MALSNDFHSFELGPIDPADPTPLYQQLRDRLRGKLVEGWPKERPIPSERVLMQMTGLSRMTVRQAIAELVHEGMLRRDHGRGTFVADSRVMRLLTGHSTFRDAVQKLGSTPVTQVIRRERIFANPAQATLLQIEPGEAVFNIVRLRKVDGQPVIVDFTIVPERICPCLGSADLTGSLYEYLAGTCGVPPDHSTDTIEAVAASGEVGELLEVEEGAPVLLLRRLARSVHDVPIEITEEFVRSDRCLYQLENPSGTAGIALVGILDTNLEDRS
ncbi:MAG: GntR family transcriptional regulator [Thermomicrobiales bacterium]|nr:GntR family transcriptional regulator [Thermomicrobiales bacterium]MCO5220046.1 GntR family transcriptional regulator [Thermomicrobiales bacterium]